MFLCMSKKLCWSTSRLYTRVPCFSKMYINDTAISYQAKFSISADDKTASDLASSLEHFTTHVSAQVNTSFTKALAKVSSCITT